VRTRNAAMQHMHGERSQKIHIYPALRANFEHLVKPPLPFVTIRTTLMK
jgi:hypothetical protein